MAQELERGVEFSIYSSSFFGGDSGPTTVGGGGSSETRYDDTFDSGLGFNVHYFRQLNSVFRWQAGLIHQRWPGEFFEGGELQAGWHFGAGGRFDDLTLSGIYGGVTAIGRRGAKIRPFASMDLAIVAQPALDVVVLGIRQPYWSSALQDYLLVKAGVAYAVSDKAVVNFFGGFSTLGKPDSVTVFSAGTAGSAVNWGIGAGFSF